MKTTAKDIQLQFDMADQPYITLTLNATRKEALKDVSKLQEIVDNGKQLDVEIQQHRKKRSMDANAYCWVLCQKIAEVIGSTKEEVYQKAVRDVGQFEILPIREEAVETWIERWGSRGLGWFAEVMDDSKLDGYKRVISYYGSSVYDTREMSILIDALVQEARELGIETMPAEELQSLINEWEG